MFIIGKYNGIGQWVLNNGSVAMQMLTECLDFKFQQYDDVSDFRELVEFTVDKYLPNISSIEKTTFAIGMENISNSLFNEKQASDLYAEISYQMLSNDIEDTYPSLYLTPIGPDEVKIEYLLW